MRLYRTGVAAIAALLLLCQSASAGDLDTREAVPRTEAEKVFVLDQMRLFLTSIVGIEEGLAAGDMAKVAKEAAARGRKANATLARPPALAAKESEAWKSMIGGARTGFDQLAGEAAAGAPTQQMLGTLAKTMQNCIACHQAYRISVVAQ